MKVLVTGGTGFIGRALVKRLVASEHRVTVWTRSKAKASSLFSEGVHIAVEGSDDLDAQVSSADAVVHLAGASLAGGRWTVRRKQVLVESRVGIAERLVAAMRSEPRPAVFVSISAVGYYGDRGAEVVSESDPNGTDFLAELCARWEQPGIEAASLGVRSVCLRCGVVLGIGGDFLKRLLPVFKAGIGGRLGSGQQYVSWIHLDDLIELFLRSLVDERFEGAINACAPEPVTNAELTRVLGAVLHRPTLFAVPAFVLKVVFGELSAALLTGQRVIPERARSLGFEFGFPTLGPALKNLLSGA